MNPEPLTNILEELILDCYILKKMIVCPKSAIQLAIIRIRNQVGAGKLIPQSMDDPKVSKSYDSVSPGRGGRPPKAQLAIEGKAVVEEIKIPGMNKVYHVVPKDTTQGDEY